MPILTELPPRSGFLKNFLYPPLRAFFYFFFMFVPYYPVRRVKKPDLTGPFLWASSHSNFLCDVVPGGTEGPRPAKFLGKSTLFKFPIKTFIEFCGALPVARAEDLKNLPKEARSAQNRSTFKAAIAAMKQGWPIAIFPEGMSVVAPGLVLPLKPGVAKLAFAAEEENGFNLGVRIIPVGLEYGSRTKVASGLTIRYGNPIRVADYKDLYLKDEEGAVRKLMDTLTSEMVSVFPHFKDEKTLSLGKKLLALGLVSSKHSIAQLFLRKEADNQFWIGLDEKMRAFEEATKDKGIPVPAWGLRRQWKDLGANGRRLRGLFILLGIPFGLMDLINNSMPELCVQSLVEYLAVDETEKMTIRFMISPVILGIAYGVQFVFMKAFVFENWMSGMGFWHYVIYTSASFVLWYAAVHWRRQLKRLGSIFFFKRAKIHGHSEAVGRYRALRQHLGDM